MEEACARYAGSDAIDSFFKLVHDTPELELRDAQNSPRAGYLRKCQERLAAVLQQAERCLRRFSRSRVLYA